MVYDVIVLGAGAAGLYCAAHLQDLRVLVIDKNPRPGAKLLAAGSGQCNLTHAGPSHALADHYGGGVPPQQRFVKPALRAHDNAAVRAFFTAHGVACIERADGKVFPACLSSSVVLEALLRQLQAQRVELALNNAVVACTRVDGHYQVVTAAATYTSRQLVIATGGISYPQLGATGIGYKLAAAFGHAIVAPRPALASVYCDDLALQQLQGQAFEDFEIQHAPSNRTHRGALLITHFGLSGPLILDNARAFRAGDALVLNWLGLPTAALETLFLERVKTDGGKPLTFFLNQLGITDKLKRLAVLTLQIDGDQQLSRVDKTTRQNLLRFLTAYKVVIQRLSSFEKAMATAGGIALASIQPKTMTSKLMPELYCIGEVLDVDGDTGGYNLQWAFASAYAAASAIRGAQGGE